VAISFQCTCGKQLKEPDELEGRLVRCPSCSAWVKVSALPDESGARDGETSELTETGSAALPAMPIAASAGLPKNSSPEPAIFARDARQASTREFLYFALLLALIPLVLSVVKPGKATVEERFRSAMDRASAETVKRVEALEKRSGAGLDELLAVLPEGKLDASAHLPRATRMHWLYGAIAAAAFWIFILVLFPVEKRTPHHLLMVGLFTGTCGIFLLLGFQLAASATQGVWLRGRGIITLVFYMVKFIGWSYAAASDPTSNLLLSFVGFTCGVGLCEELCKALPLLAYYQRNAKMGWRGAALWGLASGAGFGVAEGIMYSSRYYNGIAPLDMYVVRFASCAALHAMWTAAVGITMWQRQETIQGDWDWSSCLVSIVRILAVPMVLHGLYDTLLKKDYELWALAVGAASFAWLVFQVEMARQTDMQFHQMRQPAAA
jgi:RsiW-degrading membrane proteinase PrsW (M82 family)